MNISRHVDGIFMQAFANKLLGSGCRVYY